MHKSGDNGGVNKPVDFGNLLEAALSNVINQLENLDKRLVDIEDYIRNDIKNKAAANRIISEL